jgi:DNA-binding MarR family transcriptional regulator
VSKEEQVRPSAPIEPVPTDLNDDEIRLQINLRLNLDEVAEIEAISLRASARRPPTKSELCRLACRMYDARRTRDRMLDRQLFGEPAWDMLLALYCLPARGELMTVTGLTYAADIPQTTGHRWQKILQLEGLIERGPHGVDLRKQTLRLTARGRSLMDSYLTRLFYCDTPVPPHPEAAGGR